MGLYLWFGSIDAVLHLHVHVLGLKSRIKQKHIIIGRILQKNAEFRLLEDFSELNIDIL